MKAPSAHQVLNELGKGRHYGVFIDDSGSPGLRTESPTLHPERKSWVAVIIEPRFMPEVLAEFPSAVAELNRLTGATEFHFTRIYSGQGDFRGIDLPSRLSLLDFMVHIFDTYRFPILVQTFDPNQLQAVRNLVDLPTDIGPFRLKKQEDAALLFLLIRVKQYIASKSGERAYVFVDEGYKKANRAICISAWKDVFEDGLVMFASSSDVHPIQLADFAAFCLNRHQLLLAKEALTELDRTFLEITTPVAGMFQNIEQRYFALEYDEDTETYSWRTDMDV